MVNKAVSGTIDERVIKLTPKNEDQVIGNHTLCANSALGIGVNTTNLVQYQDILDGKVIRIFFEFSQFFLSIFIPQFSIFFDFFL